MGLSTGKQWGARGDNPHCHQDPVEKRWQALGLLGKEVALHTLDYLAADLEEEHPTEDHDAALWHGLGSEEDPWRSQDLDWDEMEVVDYPLTPVLVFISPVSVAAVVGGSTLLKDLQSAPAISLLNVYAHCQQRAS